MREYELSVIYDLALAEADGAEAGVERLTRLVENNGGSIKNVDHWGRRRMAYPINKMIDGDYVVTRIEVDPTAVAAIEAALHIDENVYRSLVVRADELYEILPMPERREREPREPRPDALAAADDAAAVAPPADDTLVAVPATDEAAAPGDDAVAAAPAAGDAADEAAAGDAETPAATAPAEQAEAVVVDEQPAAVAEEEPQPVAEAPAEAEATTEDTGDDETEPEPGVVETEDEKTEE